MSLKSLILLPIKEETLMRQRNLHNLAIIKREARGKTTVIPSKKLYKRKQKHQKCLKNFI